MASTKCFVKIRDGADDLLHNERRVLNVLKGELESMLRKTLTQQQVKNRHCWIFKICQMPVIVFTQNAWSWTCMFSRIKSKPFFFEVLAESSKQLLDCAFERSRVIDLLPQHGSLSAGVKTYPSPLSQKPDPTGPFTPGTPGHLLKALYARFVP